MGEKYQYCVKLREEKNRGLNYYVWASKKQLEYVFGNPEFGDKIIIEMGDVVGQKKGEITDKIHVDKKNISSLVFKCQNEETANKCAEYWKLPLPFIKTKVWGEEKYTLNRSWKN